MKMYFDPNAFELIRDSVSRTPKKFKLAVVDSFTLYMLLQLLAKGERFAEHKITLDILRPYFSPTNDKRRDKAILYFFEILQGANMITYEIIQDGLSYKIVEYTSAKTITYEKSDKVGEPRKFVLIRECNRHILEDKPKLNNVPFAYYCLLKSLKRRNEGTTEPVRIAFDVNEYTTESGKTVITKGIMQRLDVSNDTLVKSKRKLEEDGYIFTIRGWNSKKGYAACNEYWTFDYESDETARQRKPEKYLINQMRIQQRKPIRSKDKQVREDSTEPTKKVEDIFDFDF